MNIKLFYRLDIWFLGLTSLFYVKITYKVLDAIVFSSVFLVKFMLFLLYSCYIFHAKSSFNAPSNMGEDATYTVEDNVSSSTAIVPYCYTPIWSKI